MLTLLEALTLQFPESSKNSLRLWIAQGRIFVDGHPARVHQKIHQDQKVTLGAKREPLGKGAFIVYEDSALVVVDKPAGLLSVATEKERFQTLHHLLKRRFHCPRIVPVHRLDRETAGLILFVYHDKVLEGLKKQLEKRTMHRAYQAIVRGRVEQNEGTWAFPLRERKDFHVIVDPQGQKAVTHFRVLERRKKTTLLALTLETGRKHQIRVHCAAAGHSILGDERYGFGGGEMKLHANQLKFLHPETGKFLEFRSYLNLLEA